VIGLPASDRRHRYREVATTLTRHGMGAIAARLGLDRINPLRRGDPSPAGAATPAVHLRLALEELGAAAIKLGQILSTRPDLVPPEYIAELEKLRDRVPPVETPAVVAIIEAELGRPCSEVFATFDETPLAGASIGQVHAATLPDGTRVAVKVRKPGVLEQVTLDLAILADLARRAAKTELLDPAYDIVALVDEFSWTLRAELDYVREGRNADRLRTILAEEPRVLIPRVFWDVTTPAVLVMDRIDGISIADVAALDAAGVDRRALARTMAEVLMKQVFEEGFYHADPHAGNFLVLADGRIGMLDFGMTGLMNDELRHALLALFVATIARDATAITDEMEQLGILRSPGAREAVRRDVQHVLDRYYGLPVDQFSLTEYINDVMAIVHRHRLQLPAELALVLKTVGMSEGLWRHLDPSFNAAAVAEPFVERAASAMLNPRKWGRRAIRAAGDTVELGASLPGQVRRIAARLDRGEFEVALRHRDLHEALERTNRMITRLALAIIAAAFIMGLPVVLAAWEPPGWHIIAPAWFAAGMIALLVIGVRLLILDRPRRH